MDHSKELKKGEALILSVLKHLDLRAFNEHVQQQDQGTMTIADVEAYAQLRRDIGRAEHGIECEIAKLMKLVERATAPPVDPKDKPTPNNP